jgi:hypothetical protein
MSSKLRTQVPGAESALLCLLGKLEVGGGCVYRWAYSDPSLEGVDTQGTALGNPVLKDLVDN